MKGTEITQNQEWAEPFTREFALTPKCYRWSIHICVGQNTGWAVNNAPKHNGNFENWIGRRGTVEWAPRSPDLTPMDFYFWGHLKQIVYSTRIADVDQLRQQIIRGCNLINGNSDLLDKVYGNFEHRLELCINANGEHFEHL